MSTIADELTVGAAPQLKSLLKKPSKVLTVGVEFVKANTSTVTPNEISILSMQLRKSKVSAIWCNTVETTRLFSEEQATAQGNFPGPVPVIFDGPWSDRKAAREAGASAIVASINDWKEESENGEVVWKVSSVEDARQILEAIGDAAASNAAFLLDNIFAADEDNMQQIMEVLPRSSLCIASLNPMQPDGVEVEQGRQSKKIGCASVVIRDACVGDTEDTEYTQFLVNGLTSKASAEFKFSGLTGSTNGHFGGIQANSKVNWRRAQQ
jgi:hypothetical protein